ncbi:MAG: hypothetical protein ACTSX8_04905 [Alphaproteobacteria bacterium]
MLEAILIALVAMSTRGECLPADHYPEPGQRDYVLVGDGDNRCAIPTIAELPPRVMCSLAWDLADPTGLGDGIRCEIPEERGA